MEPTTTELLREIRRTQDLVHTAAAEQLHVEALRQAVADGVRVAVADPETWSAGLQALRGHAEREAGGWLFGGIRAIASRVAWVLVIGMGLYLIGGWRAIAAVFKTGGGQP